MLTAVKKGRPVNEAEMPPPVATGAQSTNCDAAVPQRPAPPVPSPPPSDPCPTGQPLHSGPDTSGEEELSSASAEPALNAAPSPEQPTEEPARRPQTAGL